MAFRYTKISRPEGLIAYRYDEVTGLQTEMSTSLSDTKYDCDVMGRLTAVNEWKRNGGTLSIPVITSYAYSKDGMVEEEKYSYAGIDYRDTVNTFDPQRRWLTNVTNKGYGGATASTKSTTEVYIFWVQFGCKIARVIAR